MDQVEVLEKTKFDQITEDDCQISLKITGDGLDGQIDAAVASEILKIQEEVFRIAKIVMFGEDAHNRRLSRDVQRKFLAQFKVQRGCTELLAEIVEPLTSLFTSWGNRMTPDQVADVAKTIAYVIAGGVVSCKLLSGVKDLIAQYIDQKHDLETTRETSKHAEAVADKVLESAHGAVERILEKAAKLFPTANQMDYGSRSLDQQQLDTLRGRSPRSQMTNSQENKKFLVLKLNGENRPTFYADLQELPSGEIIKAVYSEPEDSLFDGSDDVVGALSTAFANNEPISLSVVYSRNSSGDVARVTILGLLL